MATLNRFTVLLVGAAALACSAWAQQPPDQDQYDQYQDSAPQQSSSAQVDPPTRVARVAYLSGEVSFAPAGESDWSRAQRNRPMVTGDKLYTNDGRAELQIGTSSLELDRRSNMDFLTLNDQMTQVELTQGSLNLDVRRLRGGEVYEVDTPTIAFVADRPGSYRIDVGPDGHATTVSALRGSGDAIGESGNRMRVEEGQCIVFNDSQLSDYRIGQVRGGDSFDSYVNERVVRYERAPAPQYVSEEMVGYEDLDDNGAWEDAPEYGHVWYPTHVAADWAPYHDGSWDWVEPWGWTWVDDAPWGFAPFHYGRWAYIGSRWGWVPGPVDVTPVYAPALVAFVGGGGFGIDISVGGPIGWFALGPGDVYFPGYPCGRSYFNNVNISNTVVNNTVVNNYYGAFSAGSVNYAQINYANRAAPHAMTAMPAAAFASGRPVATSAIAVNRTMLANARIMPRATVVPTAASLVASRGRAVAPPATVSNRAVVAANRPAAVPAPFAQRQAMLRQHPGQPLTAAQMHTVATRTNVRNPGVTRSNVRVAGTAGAMARTARANARAGALSANGSAPPGATATQANARSARLRSSGFAHQGNPPANRNAPLNAREQVQTNSRATAASTTTTRARAQLPSSRYAQQGRGSVGNAQANGRIEQQRGVNARTNAKAEQRSNVNAPVRSNTYAAQSRAAQPRVPPAATRANERAQTRMSERAQMQIRTPRPAEHERAQASVQQQTRVNERAQAQNRAAQVRANEQQRAQARVQQQARVNEQQHTQARVQQQARVNEQQRAQARVQQQARVNEQQRPQAQYRAPERMPPTQMREPPRAQAQYREPSHPTNQRDRTPQRQAKRKEERRDQNGGG